MGRIRGKMIRQSTLEILRKYKTLFGEDYTANKAVLSKSVTTSKTVKNKIAGYITKLAREKKIEEYIIEHATK
ncbi:MAG: 30S ribosomal protein S17e [Candidatus Parvarchaeota archaeon]|jgi:Ribosomal protein S17E|nr:30S ribosomal protein S17e [Candidatus Parvarchaeota archaeon]MCL5101399.1 30S ribosomal protein S17e [Candidatus Parvarchaeota archaeon]